MPLNTPWDTKTVWDSLVNSLKSSAESESARLASRIVMLQAKSEALAGSDNASVVAEKTAAETQVLRLQDMKSRSEERAAGIAGKGYDSLDEATKNSVNGYGTFQDLSLFRRLLAQEQDIVACFAKYQAALASLPAGQAAESIKSSLARRSLNA